jgi:hypothetical protein
MNNAGPLLVCCWLALAATFATAADSPPQVDDYHEIFAQFAALGLPDVAKATYVKVECAQSLYVEDPLPYDHESSGNAWMLSETCDAEGQPTKGTFSINGGVVIELARGDKWPGRQPQADPRAAPSSEPPAPVSTWRKANLRRDIKLAMRFLKSLSRERFPEIRLDAHVRGRLLLLAFDLHQRGDTADANALLDELFKHVKSRQQVIVDALNMVADAQYENRYRRFRTDYDWVAYRDGVQALLEAYPRWRMEPVMRLLLGRIEERLAQPSPVPVATEDMTEADLALASRMMDLRAIRSCPARYGEQAPKLFWLVPASWRSALTPIVDDVELEVRSRGLKSIPFLLALTKDESLTAVDIASIRSEGYGPMARMQMNHESLLDKKSILAAFESLSRPATRGEVARRWLTDMVPVPRHGREELLSVGSVRAFYGKHHRDSDEALAVLCLPKGYGEMDASAVDFLLKAAQRGPVLPLEQYLLSKSLEPRHDNEALLVGYLAIRGVDASSMIEPAVARMLTSAENYVVPKGYEFYSAEDKGNFILRNQNSLRLAAKRLKGIPYNRSTEELLGLITGGGEGNGDLVRKMLLAKLGHMPLPEAIGILLQQAVVNTQPHARAVINEFGRQLVGKTFVRSDLNPQDHAEAWRTLIIDDRATDGVHAETVSDKYLTLNELLFSSENQETGQDDGFRWYGHPGKSTPAAKLVAEYGDKAREWLRERVRLRLTGTPEEALPRYPSEESLDAAARAILKNKFAVVDSPDEAVKVIEGLSIYERVALPDLLGRDPTLNAKLSAIANRITKVTVANGENGFRAKVQQWKLTRWQGRGFSIELLNSLQAYCTERAKAGQPVVCILSRKRDFGGCEISFCSEDLPMSVSEGQGRSQRKSSATSSSITGLSGLACARDLYASAFWRTAPPPRGEEDGGAEMSAPEVQATFQRAIDTLCSGNTVASEEAFVVFRTQGDPQ